MLLHKETTDKIIKAYYNVYNKLGYGFLEKVYENALMLELAKLSMNPVRQHPIEVFYDDKLIGNYFADILVNEKVIIEIKAAEVLIDAHEAQLLNYLKATEMEVGLLLNFGPKPEFKRRILTNNLKQSV